MEITYKYNNINGFFNFPKFKQFAVKIGLHLTGYLWSSVYLHLLSFVVVVSSVEYQTSLYTVMKQNYSKEHLMRLASDQQDSFRAGVESLILIYHLTCNVIIIIPVLDATGLWFCPEGIVAKPL